MKSIRLPSGGTYFAHEHNALRSDAAAAAFLHVHQQLGALALGTTPTNGQTVTLDINGSNVVFKAVTGTPTTAGDVKAPGTAAGFVANLWAALINPTTTTATFIALSSANAVLIQYLGWGLASGGTTITPYSLNTSTYGPLTSFSASTTVTSGSWTAQTMQLYVQPGTYYVGTTRVLYLGGSTPTFTAPVSHPRIDLVTADSSGAIALVTGSENVSPVAPSYPANKLVLAEVTHAVGETALYDNDNQQSGQGFVSNDVRPTLAPPYISSQSQIASGVAVLDPGSDAEGDILYYSGSSWVNLAPGTSGQVLITGGASAIPSWGNPTSLVKLLDQQITAGSSPFTTSSFAANGYLRVVVMLQAQSTNNSLIWRFNGDSATNYSVRGASNNGATTTSTSVTSIQVPLTATNPGGSQIHVIDVSNYSGAIKVVRGYSTMTDGTSTSAPETSDYSGLWNNTSAQITTITVSSGGTPNFTAGDRIIVYGN